MTWALNFQIKDNKVDVESVRVSGTMPDGEVALYGHQTDTGQSLSVVTGGLTAGASSYTTPPAE